MGAPLPFLPSEIRTYGIIHGFDTDMQFFYRCMIELDMEYFKHYFEKQKAENKNKPPSKAPARNGARPAKRRH